MKQSGLLELVNRKVIDADLTPQDAGLLFGGQVTLNIYNNFKLTEFSGDEVHVLIGAILTDVYETSELVSLKFNNGAQIDIDLRDCAYSSPEAMQIRIPGRPIIIIN